MRQDYAVMPTGNILPVSVGYGPPRSANKAGDESVGHSFTTARLIDEEGIQGLHARINGVHACISKFGMTESNFSKTVRRIGLLLHAWAR